MIFMNIWISSISDKDIEEYKLLYKDTYKIDYWLNFLYYYGRFDMEDMKRIIMINVARGLEPMHIYNTIYDYFIPEIEDDDTALFFQDLMEFTRICAKFKNDCEKIVNDKKEISVTYKVTDIHNENLKKYEEGAIIVAMRRKVREDFCEDMSNYTSYYPTQLQYIDKLVKINKLLDDMKIDI